MKLFNCIFLVPKMRFQFLLIPLVILTLAACGGSGGDGGGGTTNNNGPWLGNWLLVNFLSDTDNGVWDADTTSGIGMKAEITESEWKETDDGGCAVTFSYSVDGNSKISFKAKRSQPNAGIRPLARLMILGGLNFPKTITSWTIILIFSQETPF